MQFLPIEFLKLNVIFSNSNQFLKHKDKNEHQEKEMGGLFFFNQRVRLNELKNSY
jgi:hypothetical protein